MDDKEENKLTRKWHEKDYIIYINTNKWIRRKKYVLLFFNWFCH